ncbi:MAG: glutaminyl-peptide cyclotransferase [Pseudomonadota bacterium]|nr:glutaminyl-peptide cyclotransferase [Pseudomonadota bacterium]
MRAFLISLLCIFSCIANADDVLSADTEKHDFSKVKRLKWSVVSTLDHDKKRFTQGLAIHDHRLFESTGLYGRSALFETNLKSGEGRQIAQLLPSLFGEGLTVWRDRLVMLTWREGIAQYFDLNGKAMMQRRFNGEGWGITTDGSRLIMSDGTAALSIRDPQTFAEISRINVRAAGVSIDRLNELEYARQSVFANIWQTDRIVQINPKNGDVIAWLDLSALKQRFNKPVNWDAADHVLNGIAYDSKSDRFYVTGKCWPTMFVLEVDSPETLPAKH